MSQIKPYPLRLPPELREALEAMAENNRLSLHSEILDILNSAVEGFERVESKEQAIKALRLLNDLDKTINHRVRNIVDFLSEC